MAEGEVRYQVFHGQDLKKANRIATLVFEDDKLVDSLFIVPAWWDEPREDFVQPYLTDIKRAVSPDEFQRSHTSLVMIREGGDE